MNTKKKMERHMAKGLLYKHFDLERKYAKQTEARLGQRLQSLEDICLYHMKCLAREQRQLQKELQRLQQDVMKKKLSSYFGHGIQEKPKDVLGFSPQGVWKHRAPQPNKPRALATSVPRETRTTKSHMPSFHCAGLRVSRTSRDALPSQNSTAAHFTEERPQAQNEEPVNPPEDAHSYKGTSRICKGQEVFTNSPDQGHGSSPAGDCGMTHADETTSTDANLEPDQDAGGQVPWNPMEWAGSVKAESTKTTYLELFEKVRNAHYIRHRVPPESERLLTTGEIFGHADSAVQGRGAV
ncbi:coiled-coil domain-containing protein 190 isoform X2 [Tamandua tetradactyla]|uniref:coiled-coil domain-containing protein 190 isoform X2 n=1 Tax=Tamandua tetradactyla TaxID=48850 RepID=UPI004053AC2A